MNKYRRSDEALANKIMILKFAIKCSCIVGGTSNGCLKFFHSDSLEYQCTLYVHQSGINKLIIINYSVVSASKHSIVITDIEQKLNTHQFDIYSPISVIKQVNSDLFITGSSSGSLEVWSISSGKLVSSLGSHSNQEMFGITAIKLISNASLAVTAGMDNKIKLWDMNTFQPVGELRNYLVLTSDKEKGIEKKNKNEKLKNTINLNLCVKEHFIISVSNYFVINIWEKKLYYEEKLLLELKKTEDTLMLDIKFIQHQSAPELSITIIIIFIESLEVYEIDEGQILRTFKESFGVWGPQFKDFQKYSHKTFLCLTQDPEIYIWEFSLDTTKRSHPLEIVPTYLSVHPTKKFIIYTGGLSLFRYDLAEVLTK